MIWHTSCLESSGDLYHYKCLVTLDIFCLCIRIWEHVYEYSVNTVTDNWYNSCKEVEWITVHTHMYSILYSWYKLWIPALITKKITNPLLTICKMITLIKHLIYVHYDDLNKILYLTIKHLKTMKRESMKRTKRRRWTYQENLWELP